jgi:tetratricopeptide (TPR) repeat protein
VRELVLTLPESERVSLFSGATDGLPEVRSHVARIIYVILDDHERDGALLEAMLQAAETDGNVLLKKQIEQWLNGREAVRDGRHDDAIEAYDSAIDDDPEHGNPAIYFDRALVKASLPTPDYASVLDDLEAVINLASYDAVTGYWSAQIAREFERKPGLVAHFEQNRSQYPALASAIP